jgi:hypothetical protein
VGNFTILSSLVLFVKHNYNYQVMEDEIDRACNTHGEKEERIYGFGGKARRKQTTRKTLMYEEGYY